MIVSYCDKGAEAHSPVHTICTEMARRFHLTEYQMVLYGNGNPRQDSLTPAHILAAAVTFADDEYKAALPQKPGQPWQAPRQNPKSFVRFLDALNFYISWYLTNRKFIDQVQAVAVNARIDCLETLGPVRCGDIALNHQVSDALLDLWVASPSFGGWGVRALDDNHPEQSPDETIQNHVARCSEWTSLQFSSALIAGIGTSAQIFVRENFVHIEPYLSLGPTKNNPDNRGGLLWNRHLFREKQALPATNLIRSSQIRETPLSDVAIGITINRTVLGVLSEDEKYNTIHSLLPFVISPEVRSWAEEVMGDYVYENRPCLAATHYRNVDIPTAVAKVQRHLELSQLRCKANSASRAVEK